MYSQKWATDDRHRYLGDLAATVPQSRWDGSATGVTVITTEQNGEARGMTASAFMSGSLHPPLCVISIAKTARMHELLLDTGKFGVSMLSRIRSRCRSTSPDGRSKA